MTRVYVQPTGRRVAPFDDPVDEVPIANRPLSAWQDDAFREAGLERVGRLEPPCLVVPDALFTTGEVLRRFVEGAAGKDAVLVLADSTFADQTVAMQPDVTRVDRGWRFDAVRFHVGSADVLEVVVDPEEQVVELDLAKALVGDETPKLSLPRHPVMTVHHWAHLLWANQAAGASEVRRVPRWLGVLRVLWAVLRAMSLNKWKVLAKLNTVGKGCDIHPTAVVEGCNLGDNVTIGAHARVLFSRLDDGVEVMTGAHVEASTLGARSTVAQASGMRGCVLYPDAFASFPMMQATVLGREVLTTAASYAIDLNLERDIRVLHDGALVSAGTRFLGAAIGHRCRIGTGLWIASGREVPNDTILVRDPDFVMARTPTEAGRTWTLRGGRAVALTSKSQEERPTPEE